MFNNGLGGLKKNKTKKTAERMMVSPPETIQGHVGNNKKKLSSSLSQKRKKKIKIKNTAGVLFE